MNYLFTTFRCKECKENMILDDVDYNFKGNQDNYFTCNDCHISALVNIRYYKIARVTWSYWKSDEHVYSVE